MLAVLLALATAVTSPDTARPGTVASRAATPARTVVYPLGARREGRWRTQRIAITGSFSGSLPDALREALPDSLLNPHERLVMALDLAAQLRWQVDFTRDLDDGDRYAILFERFIDDHGEIRYGRLDGVELHLGGEQVTAFAFDAPDGRILYFDEQGRSLERNFLSSPMDVERVTSGFTHARFHPVLRRWRAHEGIDYAANTGTPVRAVAEGSVVRAGWSGGYGQMVEIRHPDGVVTRYGHLSRIAAGVKAGSTVSQGDVIGAVGRTGLATGPHLHFELRVNGRATDPRRLPRDGGRPIAEDDRIAFVLQRSKARLMLAEPEREVAQLSVPQ
jgi:murein DD-endopeptidase MepM/ murein hydrolase activator NlpD